MRVLEATTRRPLDLLAIGAGGRVAAASSDYGVRPDAEVWDAAGKHTGFPAADPGPCHTLAFLPDGFHLVTSVGSLGLIVRDVRNGNGVPWPDCPRPATHARLTQTEVAVSVPAGVVLAADSDFPASRLSLWAVGGETSLGIRSLWHQELFNTSHFGTPAASPDGRWVASSVHEGGLRVTNAVEVRDAGTGSVQSRVEFGGANPLEGVAFSADGSKVLARSSGRAVKVFDAATGRPAGELLHPGRPYVTGVAVHPNGTVACCRNNGAVCFWDLDTCELVRTLDWKIGKLVSVAFGPDGSTGAAGTADGRVVVWDVDE